MTAAKKADRFTRWRSSAIVRFGIAIAVVLVATVAPAIAVSANTDASSLLGSSSDCSGSESHSGSTGDDDDDDDDDSSRSSSSVRSSSSGTDDDDDDDDTTDGSSSVGSSSDGSSSDDDDTTDGSSVSDCDTPARDAPRAGAAAVNVRDIGTMVGDVAVTVSCLAGNGRVDTNMVNHGGDAAAYELKLDELRPRQRFVQSGDWARISISGRSDGAYPLSVSRNGVTVIDTTVTVACDGGDVQVSPVEALVVNGCRAGYGYLLFQLVNPTADVRSYVIEFDGVPNRSTTAQAHGAGVRAVTGRPNGIHEYLIRSGSTTVDTGTVTVDC